MAAARVPPSTAASRMLLLLLTVAFGAVLRGIIDPLGKVLGRSFPDALYTAERGWRSRTRGEPRRALILPESYARILRGGGNDDGEGAKTDPELRTVEESIKSMSMGTNRTDKEAREIINESIKLEQLDKEIGIEKRHQQELAEELQELEFQRTILKKSIQHRKQALGASSPPVTEAAAHQQSFNGGEEDELLLSWREPGFAWSDDGYGKANVTVFITSDLDGIGNLPREKVKVMLSENAFDVKVRGLNGKNIRLQRRLHAPISPLRSSYKITQNQLHLSLAKKDPSKIWKNLHWTWSPGKEDTGRRKANNKNPMGALWNMMQDMYHDGDDATRKLMNKAIFDAQRSAEENPETMMRQIPGGSSMKVPKEMLMEEDGEQPHPLAPPLHAHSMPGQSIPAADQKPRGYGGKEFRRNKPPPPPPLPSL